MENDEPIEPIEPIEPVKAPQQTPKAGGKAKANKGRGRAPAVKGAPRVGKRRQSR
ncbi:hypothetical protein BH09ACT1_BH09ACT1_28000 [soil metagenome]